MNRRDAWCVFPYGERPAGNQMTLPTFHVTPAAVFPRRGDPPYSPTVRSDGTDRENRDVISPPERTVTHGHPCHAAHGAGAARIVTPVIVIVAGVSGSGKTTIGALLAGRLRWEFADADTFHPEANVAKMRAGIPLTDADRGPWLHAIGAWMDERITAGQSAVVTCSALKRAYRDQMLNGRPEATMVFLQVSRDVLERRLLARPGHFFPEKLLGSQLDTLEPPAADERRVHAVPAERDIAATAEQIIATLWPGGQTPEAAPFQGQAAGRNLGE